MTGTEGLANIQIDNIGNNADMFEEDAIKEVVRRYPRLKWSGCFVDVIRKENALKPWAHTTALGVEEFPNAVLANTKMNQFE